MERSKVVTEKFDPYAVLGVERGASEEEVKAAFRVAAKKAHPDRPGGSTAAMTDVNMAYKILSDPAMRKAYDETGATQPQTPLEERARSLILSLVSIVIRSSTPYDDMIWIVRQGIMKQRVGLKEQREKTLQDLSQLKVRLSRLKGPPGNFIEGLIEREIERGESCLPIFDADELVIARALDMLGDYHYGLDILVEQAPSVLHAMFGLAPP